MSDISIPRFGYGWLLPVLLLPDCYLVPVPRWRSPYLPPTMQLFVHGRQALYCAALPLRRDAHYYAALPLTRVTSCWLPSHTGAPCSPSWNTLGDGAYAGYGFRIPAVAARVASALGCSIIRDCESETGVRWSCVQLRGTDECLVSLEYGVAHLRILAPAVRAIQHRFGFLDPAMHIVNQLVARLREANAIEGREESQAAITRIMNEFEGKS